MFVIQTFEFIIINQNRFYYIKQQKKKITNFFYLFVNPPAGVKTQLLQLSTHKTINLELINNNKKKK